MRVWRSLRSASLRWTGKILCRFFSDFSVPDGATALSGFSLIT